MLKNILFYFYPFFTRPLALPLRSFPATLHSYSYFRQRYVIQANLTSHAATFMLEMLYNASD